MRSGLTGFLHKHINSGLSGTLLCLLLSLLGIAESKGQPGYQLGDTIAPLVLYNFQGQAVAPLQEYTHDKGLVLIFGDPQCPYSQAYEGRMFALTSRYAPLGIPMILINPRPGESLPAMQAYSQEKDFSFPYLKDSAQVVASTFGASRLPMAFFLARTEEHWTLLYLGAIDNAPQADKSPTEVYLLDALEAYLGNRPLQRPYTRAMGCAIKWN